MGRCNNIESYMQALHYKTASPNFVMGDQEPCVKLTTTNKGMRGLISEADYESFKFLIGEKAIILIKDEGGKQKNATAFALACELPANRAALSVIKDMANSFVHSADDGSTFNESTMEIYEDRRADVAVDHRLTADELNNLFGLYFSNAHQLHGSGEELCGMLPLISMLNHSCDPNCGISEIDSKPFSVFAYTIQQVSKGDELTVSYLSEEQLQKPLEERTRFIAENFRFDCVCDRCVQEKTLSCPSLTSTIAERNRNLIEPLSRT